MARPQLCAPVMMKLSPTPSSARPSSRIVTESAGVVTKLSDPGCGGGQQAGDDGVLRAARVRMSPCPHARDDRGGELAAGNKPDEERAVPEALMHMQRQHRHRETDDQEGDEHRRHDGQQPRGRASLAGRAVQPAGLVGPDLMHGR